MSTAASSAAGGSAGLSSAKEDEPPRWLVFGAMIRTVAMSDREAGVYPLASALEQEGFGEAGAVQVTESFARHLMRAIDAWQADGFDGVATRVSEPACRASGKPAYAIDDNGDLLPAGSERTRPSGTI